jgi:hypothetical protein
MSKKNMEKPGKEYYTDHGMTRISHEESFA